MAKWAKKAKTAKGGFRPMIKPTWAKNQKPPAPKKTKKKEGGAR